MQLRQIFQGSGQKSIDVAFRHGGRANEFAPRQGRFGDPPVDNRGDVQPKKGWLFVCGQRVGDLPDLSECRHESLLTSGKRSRPVVVMGDARQHAGQE